MKTRILTMLAALLLISIGAFAQQVSESDALQKAQAFMQGKIEAAGGSRRAPRKMQRVAKAVENDAFYIFNAEDNGGFVIVSGDERTDEILGYSTEGNIDLDKMPENMRAWLKGYEEQINSLQPNAKRAPSYVPVHPAVEPLITSKWGQDSPYNLQCPIRKPEGWTEPEHCVTGCTATAMAQIMYYHKWPKEMTTAIPAYGYEYVGWDEETQTNIYKYYEDALPPTTFEWDLMKDTYNGNETGAEAQAVAKLMRYCGQSVIMNYALVASSAALSPGSLINYFGYDKGAQRVQRSSFYNNQEWDALIYGEVAAKRPVWYSGTGLNPGHAFVCDGYDGNGLYHINWGWGGVYDGYFLLSLLNASGDNDGYGLCQDVIVGIQPSAPSDKIKGSIIDGYLASVGSSDNIWGISAYFYNQTCSDLMIDGAIGLLKDDGSVEVLATLLEKGFLENNGAVIYSECRYFNDYYETFNIVPNAPTIPNLPDGTYKLVPLWKEISETKWHYSGEGAGYYYYGELIVDGDRRTFEVKCYNPSDDFRYTVTIKPIGSMVTGEQQRIAVHCVNEGIDCQAYLYFFVSRTEIMGNPIAVRPLYMDKGTEDTVDIGFTPQKEGTYHVWVADSRDGSNIIAQTDITISKRLNISMNGSTIDWSTMTMPITVTNNDKVAYDHEVAVHIYPCEDYGKEDVGQVFKSGKLHVEPGQSVDVTIDCTGLSIDQLYLVDLMFCKNPNNDIMSNYRNGYNLDINDGNGAFVVNDIWYWIVDSEHHYVFADGCAENSAEDVVIPAVVVSPDDGQTYAVKSISDNFGSYYYMGNLSNVTSNVTLSEGITTIGKFAFHNAKNLTTITLPASINRIKEGMIIQCPNLKAIYSKAKEAPLVVGNSGVSGSLISGEERCDDVILYVPKGSRASYAKAWPQFTNIVEMDVEAMQPPTKTLMGDMNGDGKRTLLDVVILVNRIMEER